MVKLLNVSHTFPDQQLATTLEAIHGEHLVDDEVDLELRISQLAQVAGGPPEKSLDLIGHAYGGVLQLGSWAVEDDRTQMDSLVDACKSSLQDLRVTGVRLLGCSTASTPAGVDAMRGLKAAFDRKGLSHITVHGTTVPIYTSNFDAAGLRADFGDLIEADDLPIAADLALPAVAAEVDWARRRDDWFSRFRGTLFHVGLPELMEDMVPQPLAHILHARDMCQRTPRWEVRQLDANPGDVSAMREVLLPGAASAPGLLAGPEVELVIPASAAREHMFYRFTVLLESSFVRIYTRAEPLGCLLAVTARADLDALVRRAGPVSPRRIESPAGRCASRPVAGSRSQGSRPGGRASCRPSSPLA